MDIFTDKGRSKLAMLVLFSILFVVFSVFFKKEGFIFQFLAIALLVFVFAKINTGPTAAYLLKAASDLRKLEEEKKAAWQKRRGVQPNPPPKLEEPPPPSMKNVLVFPKKKVS